MYDSSGVALLVNLAERTQNGTERIFYVSDIEIKGLAGPGSAEKTSTTKPS